MSTTPCRRWLVERTAPDTVAWATGGLGQGLGCSPGMGESSLFLTQSLTAQGRRAPHCTGLSTIGHLVLSSLHLSLSNPESQ